jgi:hypothetical protein
MKQNLLPSLIFICVMIVAASCNSPRYMYSPSAVNVPVLTKKGDSKLGALYSTNAAGEETIDDEELVSRSRGYDLHGAVAITDNFAIQAGHFYRWEKTEGGADSTTVKYLRNLTEIGLGYYLPMNERKSAFFQIFGGAGFGRFSFTDMDRFGINYHQANITKIYLQPAFVFRSKGSFSNSIGLRLSSINYSKIKTSYTPGQLADYNLDGLNSRAKIFFEPAYVGSFGFKNVPGLRFEFQGGLSFLMARNYIDYRKFNFSIGSWIDVGALFAKSSR